MGVLRRSYFFLQICRLYYRNMILSARIFLVFITREEGMGEIPPQSALCVMCITPRLMELWATLFAGCGKAALCFSICCEWCCP